MIVFLRGKKSLVFLIFSILYFTTCFAEGQGGITSIVNFGYSFVLITNVLLFTVIIGIFIKLLLSKIYPKAKNSNLKVFSISMLLSILLTIIFKDRFTFLIFDAL